MKRLLLSILTILYLSTSTGVIFHVHYCMGEQVGAGFTNHSDQEECSYCGMTKKDNNDCCKDEQKIIKITQLHYAANINFNAIHSFNTDLILLPYQYLDNPIYFGTINGKSALAQPPPLYQNCPLYIQNHNFRI